MLLIALLVCIAKIGLSDNITYPIFEDRFNVIIDTCINNVTYDGDFDDYGSIICRCGTYNVICFGYEDNGCSGNVLDTISWGGCEQDSSMKYLYNITGCAAAQANAASGTCSYFVEEGFGNSPNYYGAIKPLGFCQDYNCDTNDDPTTRSCRYTNDGTNITFATYSDYDCTSGATVTNDDYPYSQRISSDYVDCGVTVTQYSIDNDYYYCGSKDSKIKVNPKTPVSKNYLMKKINSYPETIGVCLSQRNGFHEYSWKYECNEAGDMVYKQIYLNSDSCSGKDYYISQNFSSLNYTVVCGGKTGSGKYGNYEANCGDQNWDASYFESPLLYGECIPFRTNPQEPSDNPDDGSLYQEQPWQADLRIVHSCANMKGWDYGAHFFFATSDCSGDYLFRVDEKGEYQSYQDEKKYPCKNTVRTKISGCSGGVSINRKGRILLDDIL